MINIVHANAQNFVWFGDGSSQIDIAKRDFCQLVLLNQAENKKLQSVDKISDNVLFSVHVKSNHNFEYLPKCLIKKLRYIRDLIYFILKLLA